MRNVRLDEAQAEIKLARRNISNLRYTDDITLMEESEELKSLLMKVKVESEKAGLKLNIQKTKVMASGPINFMGNRWGNSGNSVRLYFWGSKITADGDCSHEIKRCSLLGRKAVTNLNSILKNRERARWWRRTWGTSRSTDTSRIHLQTQKCMQNNS